ncbi:hypothetical protein Drorol1_Dr00022838 [Drosera rotundifolia]
MKRVKTSDISSISPTRRLKLSHLLVVVAIFYLGFITFKFPKILEIASLLSGDENVFNAVEHGGGVDDDDVGKSGTGLDHEDVFVRKLGDDEKMGDVRDENSREDEKRVYIRDKNSGDGDERAVGVQPIKPLQNRYGRITGEIMRHRNKSSDFSLLERMADEAWMLGLKAWEEVKDFEVGDITKSSVFEGKPEACPSWVSKSKDDLAKGDHMMFLPCGLAAGSSITLIGTTHQAHQEYVPQLAKFANENAMVMVSQFVVELQGLNAAQGEEPPKILHLNPRLRGDWSHQPVIEHNTCYRMQWGTGQRCDGSPSKQEDDMLIDGFRRCEKWMAHDAIDLKESKTTSWFKRFIGRKQKPEMAWPFPFSEGRMFILTIRAGIEGYHISVGGQHISSFPYRTGFTLEDATGLAVKGDVSIHSMHATSLPTSHPSFSPERVLEMVPKWKALPLPKSPLRLFIGVLSSTNHFAERMAARKTWMQSPEIRFSEVAVRFFVALNPRKEANAVLKKEAAYFGDIVILPFMDRYELVVLKTIAICEYGVQNVTAAYIMKCDDDTFIRLDTVLREIDGISPQKSLYMGNINLLHQPLRHGKWAVTYEEWPEEVYPPYANGPAYIISIDIAKYITVQHDNQSLRLFKMEDVSMGMWVEQLNSSKPVQYSHNWKFCQYGCMEGYYTAHYQSPRQMICLWDNLSRGKARCCNFR